MPRRKTRREWAGSSRRAFTLVELLVVIAIMALLISLIIPNVARAMDLARGVKCQSALHAMMVAAQAYVATSGGQYPIAYYNSTGSGGMAVNAWDYCTIQDGNTGQTRVEPGLLWQGSANMKVQQCPSYSGASNWLEDPYSGYNYNTSYIGHGSGESVQTPACVENVLDPTNCALFGDGQYSGGANKFMRSPKRTAGAGDPSFSARYAGTQGYRHLDATNVAFCDGHATAWTQRFDGGFKTKVVPGTGFLSNDNSMYDLK